MNIDDLMSNQNIAEDLDGDELSAIYKKCKGAYDNDKNSMAEWLSNSKMIIELASLKYKEKDYPYKGAANTTYPLITTAVVQASAHITLNLVNKGEMVLGKSIGYDLDGSKEKVADAVSKYINWQLLEECNGSWEDSTDRMLTVLLLIGTAFKKTYYDPIMNRVESKYCDYESVIVSDDIRSLSEAYQISHKLPHYTYNKIVEYINKELFCEPDSFKQDEKFSGLAARLSSDKYTKMYKLIEQHTYLDLDGDGYEEPYIITFDEDEQHVYRIVSNFSAKDIKRKGGKIIKITAESYFTDFHCISNPNGKFFSFGLGTLLHSQNKTINTLLNQLYDCGTFYNLPGGVMTKAVRRKGGPLTIPPGTYEILESAPDGGKLQDNIMQFPVREPSQVSLSLVSLLIQAAKELTGATDTMSGSNDPQYTKTGVAMQTLEQGAKAFTSIQKRIYRGFKEEFKKICNLNFLYLDKQQYIKISQGVIQVSQDDFNLENLQITTASDPEDSSKYCKAARQQQAMMLMQLPGVNVAALVEELVEDSELHNKDKVLTPPPAQPPQPNFKEQADLLKAQADMKDVQVKQEMAENDKQHNIAKLMMEMEKIKRQNAELQLKIKEVEIKDLAARGSVIKDLADVTMAEKDHHLNLAVAQSDALLRKAEIDVSRIPNNGQTQ